MRIAWVTPLSRRSGIGFYSQTAIGALSKRVDIDVWTTRSDDNLEVDPRIAIRPLRLDTATWRDLQKYDVAVFNLGNDANFNHEVNTLATDTPGVQIIHDRVLKHYCEAMFRRQNTPYRYEAVIEQLYGEKGIAFLRDGEPNERVNEFPMVEHFVRGATGVVVHAQDMMMRISKMTSAPVRAIAHPFFEYSFSNLLKGRNDFDLPGRGLMLICVGTVSRPKCIHVLIEAMAKLRGSLAQAFVVVVGSWDVDPEYVSSLKKMVKRLGLNGRVIMTDYLDDETKCALIRASDICVNLRHPNTEGASGTLVEQMYFGKAILGTDSGFFGEIPDDAILKVPTPPCSADVVRALEVLSSNETRVRYGQRCREYGREAFSRDRYAKEFLDFLEFVHQRPASP